MAELAIGTGTRVSGVRTNIEIERVYLRAVMERFHLCRFARAQCQRPRRLGPGNDTATWPVSLLPLIRSWFDRPQVQEERNALPAPGSGVASGKAIWRFDFPDCLDEQAAGLQRPGIGLQRPVSCQGSGSAATLPLTLMAATGPSWGVSLAG